MTLLQWKSVLLTWVKGAFYMTNNPDNIEDTDLEGFARFCFTHANSSTSMPSGPFFNFLTENYPQFAPSLDENGHVVPDDYAYVYTYLLHYVVVLKSCDYFIKCIDNLSKDVRAAICQFFYLTASGVLESRTRLINLIGNMVNPDSDFPFILPIAPMADRVSAAAAAPIPNATPIPTLTPIPTSTLVPTSTSLPVESKATSSEINDDEFCIHFDGIVIVSGEQSMEQSGDERVASNESRIKNFSGIVHTEIRTQRNSVGRSSDKNADLSSTENDDMDTLENPETTRPTTDPSTENESLLSKEDNVSVKADSDSDKGDSDTVKEEPQSGMDEEDSISERDESYTAKEEELFAKKESLSAKEESLSAKEEALYALEESLFDKESYLCAEDKCLCAKDKSLFIKEVSLSAKEDSLAVRDEFLYIKEVCLYTKDESLCAKEDYLDAREEALSAKQHGLNTRNGTLSAMQESSESNSADGPRRMREEGASFKANHDLEELGQPLAQSSIIMQLESSEQEKNQNNDIVIADNSQNTLAEDYIMEELQMIQKKVARIMEKRNIQNRKLQDLADLLILHYDEIGVMAVVDPTRVQDYFQSVMTDFIYGCKEQKETMKFLLQQLVEKRSIDRSTSEIDLDSTKIFNDDLQERLEMSQEDLNQSKKKLEISQQELITSQQELNQLKQQLVKKSDKRKRLELKTLNQQFDSYETTNDSADNVADLQQQLKDFEEKLKQSEQQLDQVKKQLLQKSNECEKLKLLATSDKSQVNLESSETMSSSQIRDGPSTSKHKFKAPEQDLYDDGTKQIMEIKKQCDEIIFKAQEKLKPSLDILESSNEFIKAFAVVRPKINDYKDAEELLEHIKAMGKTLELLKTQEQINIVNAQMTGDESENQPNILEVGYMTEQLISQDLEFNLLAKIRSQLLPVNLLANHIYAQDQYVKNYLLNILQLKVNVLENRQNYILYLFLNEQQKKLQSEDDAQSQKDEQPLIRKPVQKSVKTQTVLSMNQANKTS